jgi:hypothetical protein
MENALMIVYNIKQCVNAIITTKGKLLLDENLKFIEIDLIRHRRINEINIEAGSILTELKIFINEFYKLDAESINIEQYATLLQSGIDIEKIDRDYIYEGNEALKRLDELNIEIKAIYENLQIHN